MVSSPGETVVQSAQLGFCPCLDYSLFPDGCLRLAGLAPKRLAGNARSSCPIWPFLNFAWSVLFFGFQRIDLALIDIVILFVAIVANMILFWRIERLATLLLVPYAAWVVFAIVLNVSIWLLNVT